MTTAYLAKNEAKTKEQKDTEYGEGAGDGDPKDGTKLLLVGWVKHMYRMMVRLHTNTHTHITHTHTCTHMHT